MLSKNEKLFKNFNPLVESKFREFLYVFLKNYRDNPTKKKFAHLIMNMPMGYFISKEDIEHLLKDGIPTYNILIEFLSDKQNFKNIIQGG